MRFLLLTVYLAIVYAEGFDLELHYNKTGCKLPPIENGQYKDLSRSANESNVHVICDIGYEFVGESHIACNQSTENLSAEFPKCVGCALPPLANGAYHDVSQWFDTPAVYSYCDQGFRHVGPIDHVCNISTGEFSHQNYTCEDINECSELTVKEGDDVIRGPCDVNAVCTNLDGSHNCTCKEDYTGNGTYCRHVDHCPVLSDPQDGVVRMTEKRAYFTCNPGYRRLGKSSIRCLRSGLWATPYSFPTHCKLLEGYCQTPPPFENGYHIGTDYRTGKIIRNKCNSADYILTGPKVQKCTVNGWTSGMPLCEKMATTVEEMADVLKKQFTKLSAGSLTARLYSGGTDGADLVFMIDRSSSILPSSLERIRKFVMMVVDEFGVDNPNPKDGGSRVSIVTFGSKVDVVFKLNDPEIKSTEIVKQKLDNIKPHGGGTALRPALERVLIDVAPDVRKTSQKALFIIADGQSTKNGTRDPKYLINDFKRKDFELFVVGVGSLKNIEQLRKYASKPDWKHYFILKEFEDLQRLTERVVLERSTVICGQGGKMKELTRGTNKAQKGDWPWLGLIQDEGNKEAKYPICGGAIICKNWFLTSAKCVKGKKISVELGVHDIYGGVSIRLTPNKTYIHPKFDGHKYDLALLQFKSNYTNGFIKPVCLREQPDSAYGYLKDSELWIAGWGANPPKPRSMHDQKEITSVPWYTKLPVVDSGKCSSSFPGLGVPDTAFCAGHRLRSSNACRGDIGGPLLRLTDQGYEVVGLASRTENCAERNQYGMFTEVLSETALGWIHNVTNNCNLNLRENKFDEDVKKSL